MSLTCKNCNKLIHSVDAIYVVPQGTIKKEALCQGCYQFSIEGESELLESLNLATAPIDMDLYRKYLASTTWARKRYQSLQFHNFRCDITECRSENNVDVFHSSFEQLGQEQSSCLMVRCDKCKDYDILSPTRPVDPDCLHGTRYALGLKGYKQDFTLAVEYLQKSTQAGCIDGMYQLYCLFGIPDWYELHWFYSSEVDPQFPYTHEYMQDWLNRHRANLDAGKSEMIEIVHRALKKNIMEAVYFFQSKLLESEPDAENIFTTMPLSQE